MWDFYPDYTTVTLWKGAAWGELLILRINELSETTATGQPVQNHHSIDWCSPRALGCLQICLCDFSEAKKITISVHIENFYFPLADARFCFVSPHDLQTAHCHQFLLAVCAPCPLVTLHCSPAAAPGSAQEPDVLWDISSQRTAATGKQLWPISNKLLHHQN